jgi:deoxyribodipyrimidine photo-lyase
VDDTAQLEAWQKGQTGYPLVDAGMRELWHTGYMHNRVRMVVASFLIKHLRIHWKHGMDWFWDTLLDADLANNTASWQWVAGSGPDAAPFFRIFNPDTQAKTHDPDGIYVKSWLAEGQKSPPKTALAFFQAAPRSWQMTPNAPYPAPLITLPEGRKRALSAYEARDF